MKSSSKEKKRKRMGDVKISVVPLTHIPPDYGKPTEMTLREKKEFYSLPLDVQLYQRQQYRLNLGEPDTITKPDDEDLWFSNKPFVLVPNEEKLKMKTYGGDFDNEPGPTTKAEKKAWKEYLDSLPDETRTYIQFILDQEEEDDEEEEDYSYLYVKGEEEEGEGEGLEG